jgi:hypothetical protein
LIKNSESQRLHNREESEAGHALTSVCASSYFCRSAPILVFACDKQKFAQNVKKISHSELARCAAALGAAAEKHL